MMNLKHWQATVAKVVEVTDSNINTIKNMKTRLAQLELQNAKAWRKVGAVAKVAV
jgi:hypothetical protein